MRISGVAEQEDDNDGELLQIRLGLRELQPSG
jgi:hypothetical protein